MKLENNSNNVEKERWKRWTESMEKVALEIRRQDERGVIEQAKIDGEKIGIEKGMEKGIEIGIEKGKMEEKKEFAISLSKLGWSKEQISQILKISEDEVGKF